MLILPELAAQSLNPRIRRQFDQGPLESGKRLSHITLALRRTPEQSAALERLLQQMQDPASPEYHQWLTPEEFGARFGASPDALNRIADWLRAEGFTVESIARGRSFLVVSATAAQVDKTFHTEIRRYLARGRLHYAPTVAPVLPGEFQDLVGAIRGLDDFYFEPPQRLSPMTNLSDGTHALAPEDITHIYNILVNYFFPTSAQGIAVVGQSAIDLNDIRQFRSTFQLPPNDPQTVLVGDDPGIDANGGQLEADADIEWAGAVARVANITYVYAKDVMDAAQQAIDQNLAPILSMSFGACEAEVSASDATAIRGLAQQANAQGITWIASSGDAGAAACDQGSYPATQGLSVSFPASLPEVTAVGGTEFAEGTGASYWQPVNSPDLSSALTYIPEVAWNDTSATELRASGGGASALFPKPSWQTGAGVPADGARDVPDISFTASPAHDPYIVFSGGKTYAAGGTSLSTPVFAGILALGGHFTGDPNAIGPGFGNINPTLYYTAATQNGTFHDVMAGSNIVPCGMGTQDCSTGSLGYSARPGYDLVTGLGSLDALNFLFNFGLATTTTASTPATQATEGTAVVFHISVRELNGRIPSGSVGLYDTTNPNSLGVSVTLDASGNAVITTPLTGGPHTIVAKYFGHFPYLASASAPINIFATPLPPQAPTLNTPSDKSTNVPVNTMLNWNSSLGYGSYDIYFGAANPPPFWGTLAVQRWQCYPAGLAPNTTYYWKVVARNVSGSASSPVHSFTTSTQTVYLLSEIAGINKTGFAGDGGPATQATLNLPSDFIWDRSGNLYISDTNNNRVRKVTPDGVITTIAGNGSITFSGDGGPAINAGVYGPGGLAVDSKGNLYIADGWNLRVRMVSPDGTITTVAGTGKQGYSGDGGPALNAQFYGVSALAVDSADNLYIVDGNLIRQVAGGVISTIVGQIGGNSPTNLGDGGPAANAVLLRPGGIAFDAAGNLYIADRDNSRIRKVSNGIITTVASVQQPNAVAVDSAGNLWISALGFAVANITNGVTTTVAGDGAFDPATGLLSASTRLQYATGIRIDPAGRPTVAEARGLYTLSPVSGTPTALISPGGLLNAGGFAGGPLAPGSIATVFGDFMLSQPAQPPGAPLPTVLSGVSIQFQTAPPIGAPLFYASSGQVNIQIPWELAGKSSVPVSAVLNGVTGRTQTLALAPYAPGIFAVNAQRQGAIVDSSYRLVDSSNPATAGSAIQIFCTGLGPVTNTPPSGTPASGTTLSSTTSLPIVTVGGLPAAVTFSGLAPGAIGEYQVNVPVPPGVTPGPAVPVVLSIGGVNSNTVTIAVQ